MAVGAHARHSHTHYDQLLKVTDWPNARREIQKEVLDVLVRWRGEGVPEANAHELEEILREVIVIGSDDEDEEEYEPPEPLAQAHREHNTGTLAARQSRTDFSLESIGRLQHSQMHENRQRYEPLHGDSLGVRREARRQGDLRRQVEASMRRNNLLAGQHTPFSRQEKNWGLPDSGVYPHQQPQLLEQDLSPRPMFLSSANPHDSHIVESVEHGGGRKRRSRHEPASPVRDLDSAPKRRQIEAPGSPLYQYHGDPETPVYRRIDGEDIEVIDLRSSAQRPSQGFKAAGPRVNSGRPGAGSPHHAYTDSVRSDLQYEPMEPYSSAEYRPAGHRRAYIDAATGRQVIMGDEYELLPYRRNDNVVRQSLGYHGCRRQ